MLNVKLLWYAIFHTQDIIRLVFQNHFLFEIDRTKMESWIVLNKDYNMFN